MGFILPVSDISADLLLAAEVYLTLGYSVIPLYGEADPNRPKEPTIYWREYQSRRPSLTEVRDWFLHEGFPGIGIVTGRISNLIVLDFDSPEIFKAFQSQYPHLAEQQVILTRRGYHIYFQLPASLYLPTRKGQGMDLLSDGCYAVARPSTINGFKYKLIKGGPPKLLNAQDAKHINAFFDQYIPHSIRPLVSPSACAISALKADDLQAFYRYQVGQGRGRNQSLFHVSLTARDHGWSQIDVQNVLEMLHARTPSLYASNETEQQRQQEAARTIKSAFSRPARPPQPIVQVISPQIPTRAREALYALKYTAVVRLIEGLREKGVQPGQTFSRKQAHLLLHNIVGRDSIDHALKAIATKGQAIFERARPSLEPSPASLDAAEETPQPETKKCFFSGTKKSGKIQLGRKPYTYTMPNNAQLCHRLGVRFSSSDALGPDDLKSAKKTRQATHRELIRRRPGQYPRHWLAKRLGVSTRTTQNYDPELHIQVHPMYDERPVTWESLNAIPDFPVPSTFLEDENNRRFPAKREIAAHLLAKGHTVTLKRQQANFYSLDPPSIAFAQVWQHRKARKAQQEHIQLQIAVEQSRTSVIPSGPPRPAALPRSGPPPPDQPLPDKARPPMPQKARQEPAPRLTKRQARQPLPDTQQEALAQRVYSVINARTADARNRMSQASARRCVFGYGIKSVETALKLLLSRRNIANPAGFLITVLRSQNGQSIL